MMCISRSRREPLGWRWSKAVFHVFGLAACSGQWRLALLGRASPVLDWTSSIHGLSGIDMWQILGLKQPEGNGWFDVRQRRQRRRKQRAIVCRYDNFVIRVMFLQCGNRQVWLWCLWGGRGQTVRSRVVIQGVLRYQSNWPQSITYNCIVASMLFVFCCCCCGCLTFSSLLFCYMFSIWIISFSI